MIVVLKQLVVLYIFLLVGWIFGKLKKDLADHTGILSFMLVNLFLPSMVFETFSTNFTVSYIKDNYFAVIISVITLVALAFISWLIAKPLTKNEYERKVYQYSLTISNCGYVGYVLTEQVFGAQGLTDLILFCIPFTIYTYTVGYVMLTNRGSSLKCLLTPLTICTALGIVAGLVQIQLPDVVNQVLGASSDCVGPLSMILTGISLSAFSPKELVTDVKAYIVVALRLLGMPALVFGVCTLLRLDSVIMPATIMASMPCGLNTVVFPKLVGEDCKTGARLALISHLLSMATLPIWLSILM